MLAAFGALTLRPGLSSGGAPPCYMHAELDAPQVVSASPQDAITYIAAKVLEGNAARTADEEMRFATFSAVALQASQVFQSDDSATFEARDGQGVEGQFTVTRVGDGWAVTAFLVRLPQSFCGPKI
jgi:hypothetical protein